MRSKCRKCQTYVYEYIDGTLLKTELSKVKSHLKTCSECRTFYNQEAGFSGLIKQSIKQELSTVILKPEMNLDYFSPRSKTGKKYFVFFEKISLFGRPVLPVLMVMMAMIILLSGYYMFFNSTSSKDLKASLNIKEQTIVNNSIYADDCLIGDSFCDWKQKRMYIRIKEPNKNTEQIIVTSKESTSTFSVGLES